MAPCLQLRIDQHVRVNVFEVNIRVLGGLLSSHLLALDPDLNLLQRPRKQHQKEYTGQLLTHARRLADRMLPAFVESDTGALPEAIQPLRSCRAPWQSRITALVIAVPVSPCSRCSASAHGWRVRPKLQQTLLCHADGVGLLVHLQPCISALDSRPSVAWQRNVRFESGLKPSSLW